MVSVSAVSTVLLFIFNFTTAYRSVCESDTRITFLASTMPTHHLCLSSVGRKGQLFRYQVFIFYHFLGLFNDAGPFPLRLRQV